MNEQDKQLLLQDLCARLPYGVQVKIEGYIVGVLTGIEGTTISTDRGINYPLRLVKPYLRPMLSMTEEERKEYMNENVLDNCDEMNNIQKHYKELINCPKNEFDEYYHQHIQLPRVHAEDYLNSIHVDYRGLIPMGIALTAPEDMYKN